MLTQSTNEYKLYLRMITEKSVFYNLCGTSACYREGCVTLKGNFTRQTAKIAEYSCLHCDIATIKAIQATPWGTPRTNLMFKWHHIVE